ncbi:MAG: hydroxymethylbilane synthase [Elusimicrobia bacterium RIFCSPLOWO2_01_FULL_64_13]|nr:MAG: hydroxymethylbilane synthase [Elusimicrobia bacterium RIFCSPLOWO2_01_FULL_64_13]
MASPRAVSRESLKAGTRGSLLALTQTESVAGEVRRLFPGTRVEVVRIKTTGDKITDAPLSKIGGKNLFTKEIEEALLGRKIDFAVHSLKDVPTDLPEGLAIGAVLERRDAHDCLISKKGRDIRSLPERARVGTSSLRRQAQILAIRPDLRLQNLRGNLDTRLKKLEEGSYDAIVAAACGLGRLAAELKDRLGKLTLRVIPYEDMLPAVGQGFLAVEMRSGDAKVGEMLAALEHGPSRAAADCERAFLKTLQGGCQVPIGALAEVRGEELVLEGLVASLDGKKILRDRSLGPLRSSEEIGAALAEKLLRSGGDRILDAIWNIR